MICSTLVQTLPQRLDVRVAGVGILVYPQPALCCRPRVHEREAGAIFLGLLWTLPLSQAVHGSIMKVLACRRVVGIGF